MVFSPWQIVCCVYPIRPDALYSCDHTRRVTGNLLNVGIGRYLGFSRREVLSPENYNVELAGEESMDGVRAWVLEVSPKVESKFTYRGRVWVSEDDYAMVRVVGEPAKSPSWWINHASFDWRYARRGEFWLPQRNVAVSHVRIGGEARLTIDYGSYEVVAARTVKAEADTVAAGLRAARVGLVAGCR